MEHQNLVNPHPAGEGKRRELSMKEMSYKGTKKKIIVRVLLQNAEVMLWFQNNNSKVSLNQKKQ